MNVLRAREIARQWVAEEAARTAGFYGAFLAGSAIWLPDRTKLPATSDVDVTLVQTGIAAVLAEKRGKVSYRDVVLDASWIAARELQSAELVLGNYHLAGSFRSPDFILSDPSGDLNRLAVSVSGDYARRQWVSRRCEHAMRKITGGLESLDADNPFHAQVLSWLFPTGVTTHVLLLAGLRNATVRQRYVAVRALLNEYGRSDFHDDLLDLLGCAGMSASRAEHHLDGLAALFDVVKDRARSAFAFASDISEVGRPIAIDGSRDLIERGFHREAVFWIVATWSRCLAILYTDVPHLAKVECDLGYRELLADLGIESYGDLRERGERVMAFLPTVRDVAEQIMAANPDVLA